MTSTPKEGVSQTKFMSLSPILNVSSISTSIEYYVNILGFQKDWDWGEPPTFASVSRDDVCIFLCEGAQGQFGVWMSIFVADVDVLFTEYKARGAKIRQAPTNFSWGMREMNIEDPDGHRLRMGSATNEPSDEVPLCDD